MDKSQQLRAARLIVARDTATMHMLSHSLYKDCTPEAFNYRLAKKSARYYYILKQRGYGSIRRKFYRYGKEEDQHQFQREPGHHLSIMN